MVVVAHVGGRRVWWFRGLVLAGLLCIVSSGVDWTGFFREKSLSTCSTPTWCRSRVVPFLAGGRRGYPSSTSLCVPGETLGPVLWSGQQRSLPFLKVLFGLDDSMLEAWWYFSGGRSGYGSL
jgi:hypothetical protein